MNEQFHDLSCRLWAKAIRDNTKTPMNFQDAADQFAEMIVDECIMVLKKQECIDKLKQHFGIEDEY
jgi:hypothetical protein